MTAKYFTEKEFCCSHCGQLPSAGMDKKLIAVLDRAREMIGAPIHVTSGYRCKTQNSAVGGASRSYHMMGNAADVYSDRVDVYELKSILRAAMEAENVEGGLQEYPVQEFVHVDTRGYWASWC